MKLDFHNGIMHNAIFSLPVANFMCVGTAHASGVPSHWRNRTEREKIEEGKDTI